MSGKFAPQMGYNEDRKSDLHGYIHCIPHGKTVEPFGRISMPLLSSSTVPFVTRLSPLHPGYVITVCALARLVIAEMATRTVANMVVGKTLVKTRGLPSIKKTKGSSRTG
jgi:hypothetical protein